MKNRSCIIITAAGLSTRNPPNKLLKIIDKETVIKKTVDVFMNLPLDIYVITGHEKEKVCEALKSYRKTIKIVENKDYKSGLASSIVSGLKQAGESYEHYAICNGDKPFINRNTVEYLLEKSREEKNGILIPRFDNIPGHPVFFSKKYYEDLVKMEGDTGGKQILEHYKKDICYCVVDDKGVVLDMDKYLEKK